MNPEPLYCDWCNGEVKEGDTYHEYCHLVPPPKVYEDYCYEAIETHKRIIAKYGAQPLWTNTQGALS